MEKIEAIELLRSSSNYKKFKALDDLLIQALKPEIVITPTPIEQNLLGIGKSRFGGAPDLPAGFSSFQEPFHFLAQINLSELPESESQLPKVGFLYFFVNLKSLKSRSEITKEDCKVFYLNTPEEDLVRSQGSGNCFQLQFNKIYVLIDPESGPLAAALQSLDDAFEEKRDLKIRKQFEIFQKRCQLENFRKVSALEWCDLSAEEKKKQEEILALHPNNFFSSDYDLPSESYSGLAESFRTKQLKQENLKDNFQLLGIPHGWQIYDMANRDLLLSLDVTYGKSKAFPLEWNWHGQLLFFNPTSDLKNGRFDNIELELDID